MPKITEPQQMTKKEVIAATNLKWRLVKTFTALKVYNALLEFTRTKYGLADTTKQGLRKEKTGCSPEFYDSTHRLLEKKLKKLEHIQALYRKVNNLKTLKIKNKIIYKKLTNSRQLYLKAKFQKLVALKNL